MGKIQAIHGKCKFYKAMKLGYFDQNQKTLNDKLTVMQTIHNTYPYKTIFEVRSDMAKVLFIGEDADKLVSVLSGGEKVRLSILLLMLEQPDLLILDEPTNHLDIDTKNIVEDVFEAYDGPIIFISHDRYFINKVATKIVSISDSVSIFDGNYSQYIEEAKRLSEIKKLTSPKLKKKAIEDVSKKMRKLEKEIDTLDMKLGMLKQELFLKEVYMDKDKFKIKSEEIKSVENRIEEHYLEIENISD